MKDRNFVLPRIMLAFNGSLGNVVHSKGTENVADDTLSRIQNWEDMAVEITDHLLIAVWTKPKKSKRCLFWPKMTSQIREYISKCETLFYNHLWVDLCLLNGSQLKSALLAPFSTRFGIKHICTAIYSPQANWGCHLSEICSSLRSMVQRSTNFPYSLVFGRDMILNGKDYKL